MVTYGYSTECLFIKTSILTTVTVHVIDSSSAIVYVYIHYCQPAEMHVGNCTYILDTMDTLI